MAMYYLNLLPYDNIPEDGEKREDGRKRCFTVYDEEGYVVDFEAIGEVSDACPPSVGVGYDYDFVAAIYEFL
jgi:hypothetical protein